MCSVTVLKVLRNMNCEVQQLKDMAHDGCTVHQFLTQLDAMQEQIGVIRRATKELQWHT